LVGYWFRERREDLHEVLRLVGYWFRERREDLHEVLRLVGYWFKGHEYMTEEKTYMKF
jgi:thermostable 8-oxoguanine DNA glycosylase